MKKLTTSFPVFSWWCRVVFLLLTVKFYVFSIGKSAGRLIPAKSLLCEKYRHKKKKKAKNRIKKERKNPEFNSNAVAASYLICVSSNLTVVQLAYQNTWPISSTTIILKGIDSKNQTLCKFQMYVAKIRAPLGLRRTKYSKWNDFKWGCLSFTVKTALYCIFS